MFNSEDYNNDGRAINRKQQTHTTILVSIVLRMLLLCKIQGGFCDGTIAWVLRVFSIPFEPPPLILLPLLLMLFKELPPPPVVVVNPPPLLAVPPPPPLLGLNPPPPADELLPWFAFSIYRKQLRKWET